MAEIVLRRVGFNGCISGACSCRVVSEWAGRCDGDLLSRLCRSLWVSVGRFGLSLGEMRGEMRSHGCVLFTCRFVGHGTRRERCLRSRKQFRGSGEILRLVALGMPLAFPMNLLQRFCQAKSLRNEYFFA
jgi:hypothetical protein